MTQPLFHIPNFTFVTYQRFSLTPFLSSDEAQKNDNKRLLSTLFTLDDSYTLLCNTVALLRA